jgi:hypothetical protein
MRANTGDNYDPKYDNRCVFKFFKDAYSKYYTPSDHLTVDNLQETQTF